MSSSGETTAQDDISNPIPPAQKPEPHPFLFFDDGNFALQVELTLFNVHRSRVLPFMEAVQDAGEVSAVSGAPSQGSIDNSIHLPGIKKDEIEVFLRVFYDTNDIFLSGKNLPTDDLIRLLRISDYFNFTAGFDYAVTKISCSFDVPWAEKLALGLRYDKQKWIESAVGDFFSQWKPRITPGDAATLGINSGLVFMVLQQGMDRIAKLVNDLLDTAPSAYADIASDWKAPECKEHGVCMRSITSSWPQVKKKALAKKNRPEGHFSLPDFKELVRSFLFPRMNDACRELFYIEVGFRASLFMDCVTLRVKQRLLELAQGVN
ncbi:hypothetical protein V5O48_016376 [Marasmius crinis-equi]|uniref:BTB domain-containing protein n=1 Tax=Marasmius crinis-equi TaxID=585013 RepID=A0ABR3ES11_9AGAR